MKLEEVKEVHESRNPDETNIWLKKGFRMLRIMQSKVRTDQAENITPVYVMGKK